MTIWRQSSSTRAYLKVSASKVVSSKAVFMLLPSSTSCFSPIEACFGTLTGGVYMHTTSHDILRPKKQDSLKDAFRWWRAVVTLHSKQDQAMPDWKMHTCKEYGLTISKKKTNGMGPDVKCLPFLAFHQFNHPGSTVTCISTRDASINKRIGKAATTLGRFMHMYVWENPKLTRWQSYYACNVSTFVYGSEMWTTYMYAQQKRKLKALSNAMFPWSLASTEETRYPASWSFSGIACTAYKRCSADEAFAGLVTSAVWM